MTVPPAATTSVQRGRTVAVTLLLRVRDDSRLVWPDYSTVVSIWMAAGRDVLSEKKTRQVLDHEPGLMLVGEFDDQVVGIIVGTFDGRRGWLHRLAVHPEARRAGTATALVAEVEKRLALRGALRINLLVMPDNLAGLAFWRHLGYLPCSDVLCSKPVLTQ